MTTIRLSPEVQKVDRKAYFHITNLIMRFMLKNDNIGAVVITKDSIIFPSSYLEKEKLNFATMI